MLYIALHNFYTKQIHKIGIKTRKNNRDKMYSWPRVWRLSASWGTNCGPPLLGLSQHYRIEGFKRGPQFVSPLCREALVSRTANVVFSSLDRIANRYDRKISTFFRLELSAKKYLYIICICNYLQRNTDAYPIPKNTSNKFLCILVIVIFINRHLPKVIVWQW